MSTFESLPFHLKQLVFSHVLLEDRYETGKVSTEWFQLTVSTYSFREIRSSDQLLENLVMFYNNNHSHKFGSTIDLFESRTNFRAYLSDYNFDLVKKYAANIKQVHIHSSAVQGVQSLFQSLPIVDRCRLVNRQLVTFLKESSTRERYSQEDESFPKLYSFVIRTGGPSLFDLEIRPEWITKCEINMCNSTQYIDHLVSVLRVLKMLKNLALTQVRMCHKLYQSFTENLTNVYIQVDDIDNELLPVLGSLEVRARNVMFFLCQNWRKIRCFQVTSSQACPWYKWLRKQKTEQLALVHSPEHSTGFSRATVKYKELDLCNEYVSLPSFGLLKVPAASIRLTVSNPRMQVNLEELRCHLPRLECLTLSGCPNLTLNAKGRVTSLLTFIFFHEISPTALATIITACPFLHTLKVQSDPKVIWKIPDNVVSMSLRKLRIYDFNGDVDIILNHFPKLEKCSLPAGKHIKLSAEAMNQLKVFSTMCHYNREIWNEFKKSNATCKVLLIDSEPKICGVFTGMSVALVRRKVKTRLEIRRRRFVRGFSLEYIRDGGRQQIFTDPDAFEEAIKDYRDHFVVDSGQNKSDEKEHDSDVDLSGLFH